MPGSTAPPAVLLVCNTTEQAELRRHFAEPLASGLANVIFGDGGDDTLVMFERAHPEVVVIAASLEAGDARALIEAMHGAAPKGSFRTVLIGDERGPIRNALDAADFGVDRFVARPIAAKALRFAVSSSVDAARAARGNGGRASSPQIQSRQRDTRRDFDAPMAPSSSPSSATIVASSHVAQPTLAIGSAPTPPPLAVTEIGLEPPSPSGSSNASGGEDRAGAEPGSPPGFVASRTATAELKARWSALADAISEPAEDGENELLDDDDVEELADDDIPAPVRAATEEMPAPRVATEELAAVVPSPPPPVAGDDGDAPADVVAPSRIPTDDLPTVTRAPAAQLAAAPPVGEPIEALSRLDQLAAMADVIDDELDDIDELDEPPPREPPVRPMPGPVTIRPRRISQAGNFNKSADTPPPEPELVTEAPSPEPSWVEPPPREPTLILPAEPPGATDDASGAAPVLLDPPQLTERHADQQWSEAKGTPVRALDDVGHRADDRPLGGQHDDFDDDRIPTLQPDPTERPSAPRIAPLDSPPPPSDEPPARPSGTDFARELRRKMSAMAQRLFKSPEASSDRGAAVDLGVRHDHKTEIDLVALVDGPSTGGVTEIESRGDDRDSGRADHPGTGDTQVRLGAESGDIIRGVSDAAALLSRAFAQAFTGRAVFRRGDPERRRVGGGDGAGFGAEVPERRRVGGGDLAAFAGGAGAEAPAEAAAVIEKQIFFDRGRPVFASSNQDHDRMGQLLVREGKITAEQFARCQGLVAASGRRMGEILVDLGYLKRRELLPAVRRHVEDIIYSVFAWNTGQFQLAAGDGAAAERIRLSRHPAGLILEGVRRKLTLGELERLVGPPTTVVEIGDKEKLAALVGTADLSPEERAAVAALDGQNDLAAVARASGAELGNVLQLAWGLMVLGVAFARRRDLDLDGEEGGILVGETDLAIDRERVRARWQLVGEADYFSLLGVRRDATGFEIKRAYEAARRDFSPDGFPPELRRELARELDDIAQVLDEAFQILRDDRLRFDYLRHLRD